VNDENISRKHDMRVLSLALVVLGRLWRGGGGGTEVPWSGFARNDRFLEHFPSPVLCFFGESLSILAASCSLPRGLATPVNAGICRILQDL
jgi:hypothetical protein